MTDSAVEAGVTAHDLDIRIAHARERHAHQHFLRARRLRHITNREQIVLKAKRFHKNSDSVASDFVTSKGPSI
jgi:hypothetical protein